MHGLEFRLEFLIGLLGAVALLGQLARMIGVPYPIFLVLGGVGVGLIPAFPDVELPPEIIFLVFIPPLLLSAAFSSSPRDLRAHARPIGLLAVCLVLITTGAVAAAAHFVIGIPWAAAFVLGAVVAPTDPVAAVGDLPQAGRPRPRPHHRRRREHHQRRHGARRLQHSRRGGGDGYVLRGASRARVPARERRGDPARRRRGRHRLPTLRAAGGPYHPGRLHPGTRLLLLHSGREAWRFGHPRRRHPGSLRGLAGPEALYRQGAVQSYSFWEVLTFLMDSLLFILVGLEFPIILKGISEYSYAQLLLYATLVCGAVIGLRLLWFFFAPSSIPALDSLLRTRYLRAPWQERTVMGWSGMRGAVSLAAALAIPLQTQAGAEFPYRDLIIFLTYAVIFATLVFQGLTLPFLILHLGVKDDGHAARMAELDARVKATHAALEKLDEICNDENIPARSQEQLREIYEERIRRYESGLEAGASRTSTGRARRPGPAGGASSSTSSATPSSPCGTKARSTPTSCAASNAT